MKARCLTAALVAAAMAVVPAAPAAADDVADRAEDFIATAEGRAIDADGLFGLQCVDVADAYAEHLTGLPWIVSFGAGNAADHFPKALPLWDSIEYTGENVPERGDVIVWSGDALNRYGHIAVVLEADAETVTVLQQNGADPTRPAERVTLRYEQAGTGRVAGWLRLHRAE